ncbi:molybdate ABC transporter substrate-binding protein [Macrococcus capreoli]
MKKIWVLLSICILLSGCGTSQNQTAKEKITITVSAAASLKNALTEIEKVYENKNKNIDIKFNYGASGALAQQIKSGAPVDLFFSAAQDKVDDLIKHQDINQSDTTILLKNHLVLISNDAIVSPETLKDNTIRKIAIGNPEVVPAGKYAAQTLKKLNLQETLKSKMVLTKDVRQVLTYVETGNTEAGFVYASDLKATSKVQHQLPLNDALHDPITYPIAKIKGTKHKKETDALYHYLQNDACKKIYKKYGFDINA